MKKKIKKKKKKKISRYVQSCPNSVFSTRARDKRRSKSAPSSVMIEQVTSVLLQNFCLQICGITVELLHKAAQMCKHIIRVSVTKQHRCVHISYACQSHRCVNISYACQTPCCFEYTYHTHVTHVSVSAEWSRASVRRCLVSLLIYSLSPPPPGAPRLLKTSARRSGVSLPFSLSLFLPCEYTTNGRQAGGGGEQRRTGGSDLVIHSVVS
jgi:hypothetical protein